MIYKSITIGFFASVIVLSSCTKAIIDEGDKSNLPALQDTIAYNPDIQTIMYNNCVTCHGGNAPSAGVDLTNYTNVKHYTGSGNLIDRMNSTTNPMPPSGVLPAATLQKIDKWLDDGLLENK